MDRGPRKANSAGGTCGVANRRLTTHGALSLRTPESSVTEIFVDTGHWVALLLPSDRLHDTAIGMAEAIPPGSRLVTSELVLVELLNFVSKAGPITKQDALKIWAGLSSNADVTIVPASHELLESARGYYQKHADKHWSLTDCSSFIIMHDRKIHDALTYDHHFEQAGFRALLRG